MSEISSNNKRIAKNSLLLYSRMVIVMAIGLFTSRIVLKALGVEDYGIYNLVGGLVVFFTIVNAAMLAATQRYINFGLGKGNQEYLKTVFKTACAIHIILAIIIFLFAETLGLWLLTQKLLIPDEKASIAMFVFQTSIITVMVQVLTLPYNAVVVAHEKMSVFASISIIQAVLSLIVAIVLMELDSDRLFVYAVLTCIIQIIVALFYFFYCRSTFNESKGKASFDKKVFREMSTFAGWCMIGVCAGMMYTQGINILLGMFFLPFVNAARGLAVTVQSAINQIFNNVQTAVIPQLIQSYARKDYTYFQSLIFRSSKYFSFLLLIVAIPMGIRTPYVINLWLGEVPEYVVIFTRILLCISLIEAISGPLMRASDASGDIKRYHMIVGGILMTIVPIAYVFLKLGYSPQSAFYTYLAISCVALGARLVVLRSKISLSIRLFVSRVILPVLLVSVLSLFISYIISLCIEQSLTGFILYFIISSVLTLLIIAFCGINKSEREFIRTKFSIIINKIR